MPILVNSLCSALEEIEKESYELLAKATEAQFIDKGMDFGNAAELIERFQEAIVGYRGAIVHYRVSGNWIVG
jgi:hypothetical protein